MKKIFYILVSAIVALGAVACNNEIDENIEANRSEGVSFTASLDETASRILVGDLNESGKHPITFESDDVIYATYFGEGGIVAPFAFTTTDGVTFTCLENNADGLAPQTLIGQSVEFSVNELDSSKGVDGIVLYASQSFENNSTVTLGLRYGVFAFTSSHEVTLTASEGIFSWKIDEDDYWTDTEITIPAAEGIQYVPFIPQQGEMTLSYSIGGEKVKEITREFSNKIYTLGGLNEAVASVNGVNYTDLNKAIAAVPNGGTITLQNDLIFNEENRTENNGWYEGIYYQVDKSFTLDLGMQTISNEDGFVNDYLVLFKNVSGQEQTINIVNGTLDAGNVAFCALCTSTSNDGKLIINLEDVELIGNNSNGSVVKIRGGAELNVNADTKVTGKDSYLGIECSASVVNIYEGAEINMEGTSSYNGCLVGVGSNGTVNVYGGKGTSAHGCFIAMTSGGTINVEDGEWIANTDGTPVSGNSSVLVAQSANGASSIVNVSGGTFRGGYNCYGDAVGDAQINISGGNFNTDPTSYVVDGLTAVKNTETNMWDVKAPVVASVGGVEYTDFDQAVAAAVAAGQDVVLAADATVTEPILVPEGAEVTIDLNGMELSADNTTYAINNLGTLTLKDSNAGAIPSSSSVMAKTSAEIDWSVSARGIYNGYDKDGNHVSTAKLIIESGNYQATGTNGGAAVFNYGILEVKGGYFQSNGGYGLNNQTADATMTVENAKVEGGIYNKGTLTVKDTELLQHLSGKHAIYNWAGSVTIDGGEFDSLSGNELILADGENATVTINNGTFKKTAKSWLFGAATGKNISFVINDGTFYGYVNEPEMTVDTIRPYGDPIVVKGGSFNFDPTNWLAEGLAAVKNAETNMWNITTPVASVGGVEYTDLGAALDAAKEIGGEVTVNVVAGTYDSFPADKLTEGVTLECAEGTVFEGSSSLNIGGATVKGATFSNDGGSAATGTVNGDFEDCVFTGSNGHRWCYLPEDGEITYTNCVFEGSTYGVHFDSGKGAKLIFRNCEFYGFNALAGTIDVEFYGCFFGHKDGGSGYNGINLWGNTYMEDTKFDWTADGVTEFCDPCQATPTYVFNNVTVNKTGTYEPIQFSDMYQPEGVVVTIDGVVYANVATDEQLAAAIAMDVKDLNIYLAADNLNFAGSNSKAMGGASTESVTINGNGKNLYMTSTYMPAFRLQNGGGKVAISDMTIDGEMTSATTWDVYDILFYNNTEINNVTFKKSIALDGIDNGTTFDLTDVTINETKGDFYALWICANGAKVTIDGLDITTNVDASKGRGIKIDDQYMNENVEKVTLNINDATFATANKGAIMVKSTKGADITASNLDITGVVADNEFAVWVDEDGAAHYDLVTVSGCTKWLEGAVAKVGDRPYATVDAAIEAANGATVTLLADAAVSQACQINKNGYKLTVNGDFLVLKNYKNSNGYYDIVAAPTKSTYRLRGAHANNWAWNDATPLYKIENTHYYVAQNVTFAANGAFKFCGAEDWSAQYGKGADAINQNAWIKLSNDGGSADITIAQAGTYDIYFTEAGYIHVVAADSDVIDLTVATADFYLNPNIWSADSPRYSAYFCNGSSTAKFVKMVDSDYDGLYEVNIPSGENHKNIIFCRMNPSTTTDNWTNRWNQTGDLTISGNTGKVFKVTSWDGQTTGWSTK